MHSPGELTGISIASFPARDVDAAARADFNLWLDSLPPDLHELATLLLRGNTERQIASETGLPRKRTKELMDRLRASLLEALPDYKPTTEDEK